MREYSLIEGKMGRGRFGMTLIVGVLGQDRLRVYQVRLDFGIDNKAQVRCDAHQVVLPVITTFPYDFVNNLYMLPTFDTTHCSLPCYLKPLQLSRTSHPCSGPDRCGTIQRKEKIP